MYSIAQHTVKQRLQAQLRGQRVPHAQLFCGPEGCGKLAVALDFATALLCHHPTEDGQSCGGCSSCRMAARLEHPDLYFSFPTVKPANMRGDAVVSDLYLEQWRTVLRESAYLDLPRWLQAMRTENQQAIITAGESENILHKLSMKASQGGRKVMVIWLPELMNDAAANKLLKILEEPPQGTVFLLVSNHSEQLLTTILSRTQRVEFPPLSEEEIAQALQAQRGLTPEMARSVAHAAQGNYIRALTALQVSRDEAEFFDLFKLFMRRCYARDIRQLHSCSEQLALWGREKQKDFLAYSLRAVRENFMCNFHQPRLNFLAPDEADFARAFAPYVSERNVLGIVDALETARRDIAGNVNPRMVFFDLALQMILLLMKHTQR